MQEYILGIGFITNIYHKNLSRILCIILHLSGKHKKNITLFVIKSSEELMYNIIIFNEAKTNKNNFLKIYG